MHFFVSDIHLMSGRNDDIERRDRFLRFLDYTQMNAQSLWIGGDLFDFWYEWKKVIPKEHFEVLAKLKDMTSSGFPIHMMPGNHDFAVNCFLVDQVGLILHPSPDEIQLNGVVVHWVHGDGVAKSDGGYRMLKRIFRSRWANWLFRFIHPDLAMYIASSTSKGSRYKSETIGVPPDEEYIEYADEVLKSPSLDVVLMGHTHIPKILQRENGLFINSGDGIIERTYVILDDKGWRLERFEYDERLGHNPIRYKL